MLERYAPECLLSIKPSSPQAIRLACTMAAVPADNKRPTLPRSRGTSPARKLQQLMVHLGSPDAAEFAGRLGVSPSTVSRILSGERSRDRMSPKIVEAAWRRLGVVPEYWLVEDVAPESAVLQESSLAEGWEKSATPGRIVNEERQGEVDTSTLTIADFVRRDSRFPRGKAGGATAEGALLTLVGIASERGEAPEVIKELLATRPPAVPDIEWGVRCYLAALERAGQHTKKRRRGSVD